MMYGVIPPPLASTIPLAPVMSLRSRVVAVKGVRVDEIVGYGARWTVPKPGRIAVVPAGYADGLDRGWPDLLGADSREARPDRRCGQHGHDHGRRVGRESGDR